MESNNNKNYLLNPHVIYITSKTGDTPGEQINDCLQQLNHELGQKKIGLNNVVKQTIFVLATDRNDYNKKTDIFDQAIKKFYNSSFPTTSFIAQAPENDRDLSLEVYVIDNGSENIEITHKSVEGVPYSIVTSPYYKEVYVAGLNAKHLDDIYEQSESSFTQMQKVLSNEGLSFSDVVRQWNYIEEITKKTGYDTIKQNYQIFNDVRSQFYGTSNFLNGYPSATGIGTLTGGVTIEFIAVSPGYISIYPLNNPEQIDAHKYSDKVLVGKGILKKAGKTTPKFERGKLLQIKDHARIYVSGTAAVKGEISAHLNDVDKQTLTSIENVNKLLSPESLKKYDLQGDFKQYNFTYIRTYVKYKSDLERVKLICEKHFESENFQYLISDICREDLLVEIEGSINI